jgi:hypothetical protein
LRRICILAGKLRVIFFASDIALAFKPRHSVPLSHGGNRMPMVFVAKSNSLTEWGDDVGLTRYLYKLCLTDDAPEAALAEMNAAKLGGREDWELLGLKEKMIDPAIYPRIRGARGIFKVKPTNVENHVMVKKALAGEGEKIAKAKAPDIAAYLIHNATK